MSKTYVQTAAKLTPRPGENRAAAFSYWFDPPVDENNLVGSFYVVIDIEGHKRLAEDITNTIIQDFGELYYHNQFRDEPQERFEKTLSQINENLEELFRHNKTLPGHISILIAVIDEAQLLLSLFGRVGAVLARPGEELRQLNQADSQKDLIFSEIIEGSLQKRDSLLFYTQAVFSQLKKTDLSSLLTENSPSTCIHKLAQHMPQGEGASRCSAIAVNITTIKDLSEKPLSDEPNQTFIGATTSAAGAIAKKIQPHAQKAIQKSVSGAKRLGGETKDRALRSAGNGIREGWNKLWSKYINRNPRLALGIVVVGVILIFVGFYLLSLQSQKNDKNLAVFSQAYQIEQQAATDLSQGNKEQAEASLQDAQTKLNSIPASSVERVNKLASKQAQFSPQLNTIASLNTQITSLLDTIRSVVRVNAQAVYGAKDKNTASFSQLLLFGKTIYTIDTKAKNLLRINLDSKSGSVATSNQVLANVQASSVANDGSTGYIMTKNPNLFLLSPDGSLTEAKNTSNEWSRGVDIASYLGNIYILSPVDNQIYRYTKNLGGYSTKTPYLKNPAENLLQNATSMAINGNVYVGNNDGSALNFQLGQKRDLQIQNYPKNSQNIVKILYSENLTSLFLLLNDGRILQIQLGSNSAQYIRQYVVTDATNINSFAIDDSNKQIFVANSNTILSFPLQK
ncbi:hypothetical protein HYX70_03495 [Candidatus Saccharibacteria bacterium]|nr:hypothetical protein [Candidatus Saccharibacteria bacterium]